jgi:proteasome beta subunit
MGSDPSGIGRFSSLHVTAGTSSFTDFLASYAPELLPGGSLLQARVADHQAGPSKLDNEKAALTGVSHATTIIAAVCSDGVVIAGDRRATMGNQIHQRDIQKVFRCDEYSAVGIAGVGSIGLEFARLLQVEFEHYEKMESRSLSLNGKANRLAAMIRGNLGAAMQGFAVVPLFVGYDEAGSGTGRIFSYDVAGGPYEEQRFSGIGSGSVFARASLKKLYKDSMSIQDLELACIQALYDAADDDSATGGPDLARNIYPIVATVTADGFERLSDAEIEEYARSVVADRMRFPDGPTAPLRPAE